MSQSEHKFPGILFLTTLFFGLSVLNMGPAAPAFAQSARIIKNKGTTPGTRANLIPGAFNVRKGETLGMYAAWTGISARQLMIAARIKSPSDFREGMVLHLMLTPEQWMRVHAARASTRSEFTGLKPLSGLSRPEVPKPPPKLETTFLVHTVQTGENASTIARFYGVELKTIREANGGKNLSVILPGQDLIIPNILSKTPPKQAVPMGSGTGFHRPKPMGNFGKPEKLQSPSKSSQ